MKIPSPIHSPFATPPGTANSALLQYVVGEKRYILAPKGLEVGMTVMGGEKAPIEVGNALPLEKIPLGMTVHNVEMQLGRGGQLVRSAGVGAVIALMSIGGGVQDYITQQFSSAGTNLIAVLPGRIQRGPGGGAFGQQAGRGRGLFHRVDVARPPVQDGRGQDIVKNLEARDSRLIGRRRHRAQDAHTRTGQFFQHRLEIQHRHRVAAVHRTGNRHQDQLQPCLLYTSPSPRDS